MKKETTLETKPVTKTIPQKTILAESTVFEGSITSIDDVEIGGELKGDLTTEGNVILLSEIQGNVKAANLDLLSNSLIGNVEVTDKITLTANSQIKGNITAKNLVCSGKIVGNMIIDENAHFDNLSHIEGDVTAKYITVDHGAYIDGKITIKK